MAKIEGTAEKVSSWNVGSIFTGRWFELDTPGGSVFVYMQRGMIGNKIENVNISVEWSEER